MTLTDGHRLVASGRGPANIQRSSPTAPTSADRMLRRFLARMTRYYATEAGRRALDRERPGFEPVDAYPVTRRLTNAEMFAAIDADHANQIRFRTAIANERHAA